MDIMNLLLPAKTEPAIYYEYDNETQKYKEAIPFRCNIHGDEQVMGRKTQQQRGQWVEKSSLSIETDKSLPFKTVDKIEMVRNGKTYTVTGKEEIWNNPNAIKGLIAKHNIPKTVVLHLNKDDV